MLALVLIFGACTKNAKEGNFNFVFHARGGELTSNELLLTDVDQLVLAFSEGKERHKMTIPYKKFIEKWGQNLQNQQPNAVITFYDKEGQYQAVTVVLMSAALKSDGVHFTIKGLGKGVVGRDNHLGETALFVDGLNQTFGVTSPAS